jgi:hypothetical protein
VGNVVAGRAPLVVGYLLVMTGEPGVVKAASGRCSPSAEIEKL